MATSTITIISGASTVTLDNTISTITLGTSGPQGAPGEGVPVGGTAGQILAKDSATDYDTSWIDNFTTDVRVYVKNDSGSTLAKGTVVYVSGANGTNILVKPAIATSDATSATTIGFLMQSLANNASGYVITQGTITGLDTSAGTAGDPVWLSPTVAGGVVYGVANKPQAPNHLYSLGVLTRSNINNGEIQVFVNNGWELEELHNVKITSPTNGQVLTYDSAQSLWVNSSETGDISAVTVTSPITGGGTSGSVNIGIDQTALSVTASQISDGASTFARLGAANAFTVGGHTITAHTDSSVPLMVKAYSGSQTGNLFEARSSTNYLYTGIESFGRMFVRSGAAMSQTALTVGTGNVAHKGIVVQGAASQTANLQEWQDSSGGILGKVEYGGALALLPTAATNGYTLFTRNPAAGVIGHIIRGAASQTANLQEWQNSAGTVLSYVSSAGNLRTTVAAVFGSTSYGAMINATPLSSTTVGAVIRGAASQTANLTEWQNNSGTVLASVDASGTVLGTLLSTITSKVVVGEQNSGGSIRVTKMTSAGTNPGADNARIYVRDGTTAGTLKLVVRAGAAGAETTILDNIPQ